MADFESGVQSYIFGKCTVLVSFPVDFRGRADISCNQCQFYHRSTRTCFITKDIIPYPEKYVGDNCPLEKMEDSEV